MPPRLPHNRPRAPETALALLALAALVAGGCCPDGEPGLGGAVQALAWEGLPARALSPDWTVPDRYRGEIVTRRVRFFPHRLLALTFDDGPHPQVTRQVLDTLARYEARATFFVLGQNARRYPELLAEMAEAGHAVGSHAFTHDARPSAAESPRSLERTAAVIEAATGQAPTVFRPPYGITDNELTREARRRGYAVILWTISSADTRPIGPETIARNVIYTPNPGEIILMHDGGGHLDTARALPRILEELGEAGFEFVTVPELLRAWDDWQAQEAARQPGSPS